MTFLFPVNRLIKRNDALPPWIEFQKEHANALSRFRSNLLSTLTSHITNFHPTPHLLTLTPIQIGALRPPSTNLLLQRQMPLWKSQLTEVNSLGRRADGISPAPARRGNALALEDEVRRGWNGVGEAVWREIRKVQEEEVRLGQEWTRQREEVVWFYAPEWWTRMIAYLRGLFGLKERVKA